MSTPQPAKKPNPAIPGLCDPFGRDIHYLRFSVTDRCDLRCVYCMAEHMTFLPRREVLTLEEIDRLTTIFIRTGIRKLRITGGEPLVRRNIIWLLDRIGRHLNRHLNGPLDGYGLDELTLTTNGSKLSDYARDLHRIGIRRINVSLDSLDPEKFRRITRWGKLEKTLGGIDAALDAGIAVKINTVALRGINEDEIETMIEWCHARGCDISLIEVMPMGSGLSRMDQYLPLSLVRNRLEKRWKMEDLSYQSGGPARYVRIGETGGRLGFITPMTHNFCASCNRIRVTCSGTLYLCLGQEDKADLRQVLRADNHDAPVIKAIHAAIAKKPKGHDFVIDTAATARHMSVTGG